MMDSLPESIRLKVEQQVLEAASGKRPEVPQTPSRQRTPRDGGGFANLRRL